MYTVLCDENFSVKNRIVRSACIKSGERLKDYKVRFEIEPHF